MSTQSAMLLAIADAEGHSACLLSTQIEPLQDNKKARLVFRRSGEEYALKALWLAPDRLGYEIPASKKNPADRVEVAFAR